MLVSVRLVSSSARRTAVPMLSSTRESLSVQRLSDVVRGRLSDPATQSSVPRGWTDTEPARYCKRATRLGGSSSAKAKIAVSDKRKNAAKTVRLRIVMACLLGGDCSFSLRVLAPQGRRGWPVLPQLHNPIKTGSELLA